jgi:hypothetical protein
MPAVTVLVQVSNTTQIFELQLPVGRKLGICAIFLLGAL